jgi:hypothetical protein
LSTESAGDRHSSCVHWPIPLEQAFVAAHGQSQNAAIHIVLQYPGAGCLAHAAAALRVAQQLQHGLADGDRVAGRNQQPGHFRHHGVARAGAQGGHDGNPAGRGLQNDIRKTLPPGGQNHHVHGAVIGRRIGNVPGHVNARVVFYARAQLPAERIFGGVKPAHQKQMRLRSGSQDGSKCFDQLRQPFVAGQAAHKAHHGRIRRKTKPGAQDARPRREALHIDAAAAAAPQKEQFGFRSHAQGQRLVTQALTVAQDHMRTGRGHSLSGQQDAALDSGRGFQFEPAQKIDPRRHAAEHGGNRAQQPGLGRAELRHVGPQPPEQPAQSQQRQQVRDRRHLPAHGNRNRLNPFLCGRVSQQRPGA